MPAVDFLDSNVLVYAFDPRDARKQAIAAGLHGRAQRDQSAIISFQVVQETINALTRKLKPPLSDEDARQLLEDVLVPLWKVSPSPELYRRALGVRSRHKLSWYDALIVAAAVEGGCRRVLSEDLQHGLKIETVKIINPFFEEE